MTAFSALLGGGLGGFLGAVAAHILVTLSNRFGAETWLHGPYGPQFFDMALYMGLLCAGAAAGALRTLRAAIFGFCLPLAVIAAPLAVLTHTARWGMENGSAPTNGWYYTVSGLYLLATWGTLAGLGAWSTAKRKWLSAGLACAGSFAGYLLLELFLRVAPWYGRIGWSARGFLPSPVNLLDGLLTGAGLSLGIYFARRLHEKSAHS